MNHSLSWLHACLYSVPIRIALDIAVLGPEFMAMLAVLYAAGGHPPKQTFASV